MAGFFEGGVYQEAHDAAGEDGQGGADREVGSYGEGERADAEQLDRDHEEDAHQDETPWEFLAEDAVDDGGHEAGLRGGGVFAADALDPLNFDFARARGVEVFAVGKF